MDEAEAVIIENGSIQCKAGIAGDDAPRCCFAAVVGRNKIPRINDIYVGDYA